MGKIFCFMGKVSSGSNDIFNILSEKLKDKIIVGINDNIDLNTNSYMIISDLDEFMCLKEYYDVGSVIPIYIEMDDGLRLENAINYEIQQQKPDYESLCQHYISDEKKYSKDKLIDNGISKIYINNDTLECTTEIEKDILEYLEKEKQYRI